MARFVTSIQSPRSASDAFDFMADLRNFADWDPGVTRVEQIEGEGGGPTAVFDVDAKSVKGDLTLRYHTIRHQPPTAIAPGDLLVEAKSSMFTSIDRVTVTTDSQADDGAGCIVTYDAELRLNGPLRLFDLGLRPVFNRIGKRAEAGLRSALDGTPAAR